MVQHSKAKIRRYGMGWGAKYSLKGKNRTLSLKKKGRVLQGCVRLDNVFHFAELPKNWRYHYQGKNTWNSSLKFAKENLLSENNFKAYGASEADSFTLRYKPPREKEQYKACLVNRGFSFL